MDVQPVTGSASGFSWRHLVHTTRRNFLLLFVATVAGAALGLFVATTNPTYKATVLLGVRVGSDTGQTSTATETAAAAVVSPVVIDQAAATLKVSAASLTDQISAKVKADTTLIELSAANTDPDAAVRNATTVAKTAIADYKSRSAAIAKDVRDAGEEQLTTGKLSEATAERTRSESIGTTVGTAQGQSIQGTVTISIVSPALGAYTAGVGRLVGIILGAALGLLLSLLTVLSGGWRRSRKVRSAADLEDLPGIRAAFPARDVAGLTGAVLNSGRQAVVVIGSAEGPRRAAAVSLARGLRSNGLAVGQVSILGQPSAAQPLTFGADDTWTVGSDLSAKVLSRAERTHLAATLKTDVVLIDLADLDDAAIFLAGQSDFLPILTVKSGLRVAGVERNLRPLEAAAPILVLTD